MNIYIYIIELKVYMKNLNYLLLKDEYDALNTITLKIYFLLFEIKRTKDYPVSSL